MHKKHTFGVTSMGEKGQVVVPADIRSALKWKKGEKLIVIARGHGVTLMSSAQFAHLAERLGTMKDLFDSSK